MTNLEHVPSAQPGNEFYRVVAIPGKGYGCIALKDIKCGTRILSDDALVMTTEPHYLEPDLRSSFDTLSPEQKKLYFSLHSGHGQDPKEWPSRIHESVQGHERERILEQHAARTGSEASLISIFQTNCMEMDGGAAVFPYAARFNHSCNPNACFSWNSAIQKETIHVMRDVAEGEQITLSYCDMYHCQAVRAWELKHYGFVCDCAACKQGDCDDENSLAAQSEERRYRLEELERETRLLRFGGLESGAQVPMLSKKLVEFAALHQAEGDRSARLARIFLDLAMVCEYNGDLRMARLIATKALQTKKDCQGEDAPDYSGYVEVMHRLKAGGG